MASGLLSSWAAKCRELRLLVLALCKLWVGDSSKQIAQWLLMMKFAAILNDQCISDEEKEQDEVLIFFVRGKIEKLLQSMLAREDIDTVELVTRKRQFYCPKGCFELIRCHIVSRLNIQG